MNFTTTIADDITLQVKYKIEKEYIVTKNRDGSVAWEGERRVVYCLLTLAGAPHPFAGKAVCHPNDQFVKRTGRKKAFAQAVQDCTPIHEFRKILWAAWHEAEGTGIEVT